MKQEKLNDILSQMKSDFDAFIGAYEQLIVEPKKESKFKRGDFVYSENSYTQNLRWIGIFKENNKKECYFDYSTLLCIHSNDLIFDSYALKQNLKRLATEAEKQILLDAMHAKGKDWDAEKCEVVDYVWKPKKGEKFWYIYEKMAYPSHGECENVIDIFVELGNYFKTKELAENAAQAEIEFRKSLKHY